MQRSVRLARTWRGRPGLSGLEVWITGLGFLVLGLGYGFQGLGGW